MQAKGRTIGKLPGGGGGGITISNRQTIFSLYFPGNFFFSNDPGVQTIFFKLK